MEQLEMKGTQKRRMPRAGMIVLAAALAVGALLSVAAGLPARVYNFAFGGQAYVMPGSDGGGITVDMANFAVPIKAEDGRLWFEADGQHIDITDMVDENTPYIYERTDPDTGEKGCVVVGGTVENFGWAELFIIDGEYSAAGENYTDFLVTLPDGSEVNRNDLTDEQWEQLTGQEVEAGKDPVSIMGREVDRPWFKAALDQLGLELWLP